MKAALGGLLLATACAGAELRGANAVHAGEEPAGAERARFVAESCRDGRGGPAPLPELELAVVRLADGREVAIEWRRGYDSIVVTNRFEAADERIFQYVSRDPDGPELLHELRLEPRPARAASLEIADEFDHRDAGSGFRAAPKRVILRCLLRPARLDTARAVE